MSSTALSSHRYHPCSWPSSRSGRRVSSSANPGVPCGRTASLRATSGRLEHVRDVNRAHGACGWLYPPIARSVSCDRGPPSASSDSSVGSRRAAEGCRTAGFLRRSRAFRRADRRLASTLTEADSAYTGISSPTVRRHDLVDGRRRGATTLSSSTTTPTKRHHDLVDARRRGAAVSSPAEKPVGLL